MAVEVSMSNLVLRDPGNEGGVLVVLASNVLLQN